MKYMKYIIPIMMLSLVLLSCAKKDEETTADVYNCTGTSSGSGPTIGSVALEEATYLSACFTQPYSSENVSKKLQLAFKNSTEAQYTSYTYGDTSCSTLTDTGSMCMNAITVSSTAVTKPTYVDGTAGDNATGYNATAAWLHDSTETAYLQFSENSASVFWFNQATTEATRDSNSAWLFKFTKQ